MQRQQPSGYMTHRDTYFSNCLTCSSTTHLPALFYVAYDVCGPRSPRHILLLAQQKTHAERLKTLRKLPASQLHIIIGIHHVGVSLEVVTSWQTKVSQDVPSVPEMGPTPCDQIRRDQAQHLQPKTKPVTTNYGVVPKGLLTFLGFLGNAEFSPWKFKKKKVCGYFCDSQ